MITNRRLVLFLLIIVALLVSNCGSTPTPTPEPPTATPAPVIPSPRPPAAAATPAGPSALEVAMENIQRLEGATLATVNGEEITWEDYEPSLRQALLVLNRQYDVDWGDAAMKMRLAQVQNEVLTQVIDRWLMRKMAADQEITVPEDMLQAQVDKEKTSVLDSGRYADWETFLQENGLTSESFENVIYETLLFNLFLEAQEVETDGEQIQVAHIVVKDGATAQEIVDRLNAGEDFGDLAAQYSIDEQTKDSGGNLGWFTQEMMAPEIAQTAASLDTGQYSEPIDTQYGFAIIQVIGREMRPLDARALRQRQQLVIMTQLETERGNAIIVYLVDFTED